MKRLLITPSPRSRWPASRSHSATSPVQPAPLKRTAFGKVEAPGASYDVVAAMVEIRPGFKAGRPSSVVQAQVLEGEFWFAIDGQRAVPNLVSPYADHAIRAG